MPAAAFLYAPTSHPGAITGPGVASVLINGMPAVCLGDVHVCALPPLAGPHPPNPIAKGSASVLIGGRPAARQGDLCGCGASIVAGSPNVQIGG
ncbi:PAAR domain-containing protein [Caballeronia cordobensis]|uniref:Rhs family protein n=1 Tax=Caballeronia cordobensis TaxID=1353886 RepID=A0A158HQ39_CABCO|nr:PAAR domain-containing protein [Caballeronia cordobensis]AQH02650.1 PaaR repeat-containing protein [Burkholderia sp. KK1]BAO90266.1 putative membrane protein [Burkholderia sp. RPE67]SAL46061.1 Rhs family protein [Caballeronia cordobensis]